MDDKEVGIELVARDLATRSIRDVGNALGDLKGKAGGISDAFRNVGRDIGNVGKTLSTKLTLPIAGAGTAIWHVGTQFETTLSQIHGLVGISREQLAEWKPEIEALGVSTARGPQELAEALYFVTSAGIDAGDAMAVVEASGKAAAAGLGDTQDIAFALVSTINAYGAENLSAARATDIMVAAVKEGTIEADQLSGVIGRIAPSASKLGVSFEEVGGALASMSLVGLDANEATTSLNQIFTTLLKPTSQANKALENVGLSMEDLRSTVQDDGVLALLQQLETAFEGNDDAMAQVFPNIRALRGAFAVLAQDADKTKGVFDRVADSTGDMQFAFDAVKDGGGFAFKQLMAELQVLLIEVSDAVIPVVSDVLRDLSRAVREVVTWWKTLSPEVQKFIVIGAALAAALGPVLIVVGALVGAIGALLSPIGLVIAAIAGLVLVFSGVLGPIDQVIAKIGEFVGPLVDQIVAAIGTVVDWLLTTGIPLFVETIGQFIGTAIDWLVTTGIPLFLEALVSFVQGAVDWLLTTGIPLLADAVGAFVPVLIDWVGETIPKLLEALGDLLSNMVEWAAGAIPVLVEKLVEWGITFAQWVVTEAIPRLLQNLPGILGAIVGFIARASVTLVTNMIGLAANMIGKFIGVLVGLPGKVGEVIGDLIAGFPDWARSVGRAVIEMGKSFVSGFIRGLGSLPGKIAKAIRDAFRSIRIDIGPFHISASGVTIDLPSIDLPGFATGAWKIPHDMAAVVHAGEMVIPADIARRLRGESGIGPAMLSAAAPPKTVAAPPGGSMTTINITNYFGAGSVRSDEDIRQISREQADRIRLLGFSPAIRSTGSIG